MEVILLERVARLGGMGEVVKVRNGYARNFLIPMKKALRASDDNKKVFEERRHIIEEQNAKAIVEAQAKASKLANINLTLTRQASQEGKLYGSVTVGDIAYALAEAGHTIPKSQIIMGVAIKNIGEYPIRLTLHAEVIATINVKVARIESDAA